ncbi:phosphoethanolamine transferase CptA [Metabacillus litoralis]|uniref:phosphoethanolamine transferase CptA n=1 Tax=Metabacillus litoralis TaxID=152268 RepID=UPI001CFE4D8F|nr:phosphoethanolamine transferase CptA [Metabacillus litoralis]
MNIRYLIYIVIAILFGIFDFYFESYLTGALGFSGFRRYLTYGVWLVLLIPISLFEVKNSKSKIKTAIVCSITWIFSIVSYYLWMAVHRAFISITHLHISNIDSDTYFWENWKSFLQHNVFKRGIVEWGGVAIIGGFIIGLLISYIYLRLDNLRKSKKENGNF